MTVRSISWHKKGLTVIKPFTKLEEIDLETESQKEIQISSIFLHYHLQVYTNLVSLLMGTIFSNLIVRLKSEVS